MRNLIVSQIEEKDLEEVQKILKNTFKNNITYEKMKEFYCQSKNDKNVHMYGYYVKDRLVGMIIMDIAIIPSGKKATIYNLAVLEEYRRQGIATKLINIVEEIVKKENDIEKISLFSGIKRQEAHELYRKLGYNGDDYKTFYKIVKH